MNFSANVNQFLDGLSVFLVGVTVVFVTLVLLIFIIKLISKVVSYVENSDSRREEEKEMPIEVIDQPNNEVKTDELELVAVITAALAASMGTTSDKLQVRSLRKVERRVR